MPRQYVSPAAFNAHPIGAGLKSSTLAAGVLDGALVRASARCDRHCRRLFAAPGATTLSANAAQGASVIVVTDLLALAVDPSPMTVVTINAGQATAETVQLGGYTGLDLTTPAPHGGTLKLYPGVTLRYTHVSGEPIQAYHFEQSPLEGGATRQFDGLWDLTQQGQVAHAHAPMGAGADVRVVFLKQMPILQVVAVSISYPWANVLDPADVTALTVEAAEGWYRFPIGNFAPGGSVAQTTYLAGHYSVPDDVQQAVIYETAAELAFGTNFLGSQEFRRGNYSVRMLGRANDKTTGGRALLFAQESEALLEPFRVRTG